MIDPKENFITNREGDVFYPILSNVDYLEEFTIEVDQFKLYE